MIRLLLFKDKNLMVEWEFAFAKRTFHRDHGNSVQGKDGEVSLVLQQCLQSMHTTYTYRYIFTQVSHSLESWGSCMFVGVRQDEHVLSKSDQPPEWPTPRVI